MLHYGMEKQNIKIATIGSHSALQILHGAHQEGFETIAICAKGKSKPYKSFGLADKIIEIDNLSDFMSVEDILIKENAILIPHGSLIAYVGEKNIAKLRVPHYGNKKILKWESDRNKEREWLSESGLKLPKIFKNHKDIDRQVIVKFHGADGGQGYFLARTPEEFEKKIAQRTTHKSYVIQEYIVGVPMYAHFFYSPITKELEIMGFDKRYESNADSIGRIAASDQISADLETSYTVVGNIPIVLRESLLPQMFEHGENVIHTSRKIEGPAGLYGPFCLEGIITSDLEFYVFEISARIVAGVLPYTNGSPYTQIKYNEPMSMGRRIARDIKQAIEQDRLEEVLN